MFNTTQLFFKDKNRDNDERKSSSIDIDKKIVREYQRELQERKDAIEKFSRKGKQDTREKDNPNPAF